MQRRPQGDPGRHVRQPLDRRERLRPQPSSTGSAQADRDHQIEQVGARLAGPDAVPQPGRGRRPARSRQPASDARGSRDERRRALRGTPARRAVRAGGQRPHLRHHPARRRAGAGRRADRGREARGRPPARAAQGRRHRGRLPGRLARATSRRSGGSPRRRAAGSRSRRSPAARTAIRSGRSRRSRSPSGRTSTSSSRPATSTSSTSSGSTARRRWPRRSAGSATVARSWAATPRSSSPPRTPRGRDPDFLLQIYEAVVEAGASTVNIPDTVGYAIPAEFGDLIAARRRPRRRARRRSASTATTTSGLATANTLAAIQAGARQVEVTINGLGERAGNASLEEVVMALRTRPTQFPELGSGRRHGAAHRRQPAGQLPDRVRDPAQQGDRRRQRLRPRVRDPPGRRDQEPADLRDHDPAVGRADRQPADDRQAVRPARPAGQAQGARPRARGRGARRDLSPGGRARRRQEGGHRRRPARPRRAARVGGPGVGRADRLERHLVARRQRDRHGDAVASAARSGPPRRPATARSTPCSARSTTPSSRSSAGTRPHRVRDQGGQRRRGRAGPGPGPLPALVGRGSGRPRRDRPRVIDQHHRGVARGLPRGGQQAPRRRDQRRSASAFVSPRQREGLR